jgi:hypothetical protein
LALARQFDFELGKHPEHVEAALAGGRPGGYPLLGRPQARALGLDCARS